MYFQLIARLKREIQSLKEELAMVTGEQRDDQLTVEEIQKYVTSRSFSPARLSAQPGYFGDATSRFTDDR